MKLKIVLCSLCVLFLGIVGCNLFNPTEAINVDNSDADALTYEGYLKFRNNDYGEAERYFSKAIAADSSHSEAAGSGMRCALSRQSDRSSSRQRD